MKSVGLIPDECVHVGVLLSDFRLERWHERKTVEVIRF